MKLFEEHEKDLVNLNYICGKHPEAKTYLDKEAVGRCTCDADKYNSTIRQLLGINCAIIALWFLRYLKILRMRLRWRDEQHERHQMPEM
jgi:hypothetical protein